MTNTLQTIPDHLASHPQGNNIREWDTYKEFLDIIQNPAPGLTQDEEIENLVEEGFLAYSVAPYDGSNASISAGRIILSIRQAILDILGDESTEFSDYIRENLPKVT